VGALTPTHLILILIIALIVVGPGRLPEVGSAIGKSIKEFKKASGDFTDTVVGTTTSQPAMPAQPAAYQAQYQPAAGVVVPPPGQVGYPAPVPAQYYQPQPDPVTGSVPPPGQVGYPAPVPAQYYQPQSAPAAPAPAAPAPDAYQPVTGVVVGPPSGPEAR
jgi:sec-independent protein translocase protein TatA